MPIEDPLTELLPTLPEQAPNIVDSSRSDEAKLPALEAALSPAVPAPMPAETRFLKSILFGADGLRVGWSIALFLGLTLIFIGIDFNLAQYVLHGLLHIHLGDANALSTIMQEGLQALAILGAGSICALIERRRLLDYNLRGPHSLRRFGEGLLGGFIALSALLGALMIGGWVHFGANDLTGLAILQFGCLWGIGFLLTGFAEEGMVRCYLQFTLTRGVNFWWAAGLVSLMCVICRVYIHNPDVWGIYLMAALGIVPCLMLQVRKSPTAGFWQAAWLTSTFFGFIHTSNNGESWIGIFSAAAIGFIFCVSIRLTGSAWWAIGYHAAWDWAQTFFYGTADSGFQPKGHYLSTSPSGTPLFSGGTDGPEGSLLVIPIILLTLAFLLVVYRSRAIAESASPTAQPQLS